MNTFTRKSVFASIVFCALSGVSALSHAEARNVDFEEVKVSYGDLDLSTAAGQDELEMRVHGAAQEVCGEVHSRIASEIRDNRECRQIAVSQALRQVGLGQEIAVVAHQQ